MGCQGQEVYMTKYTKATLEQNVWMQNDLPCWRATACRSMMTTGGEVLRSRGKGGEGRWDIKAHSGPIFRIFGQHLCLSLIRQRVSRVRGHCSLYISMQGRYIYSHLLRGTSQGSVSHFVVSFIIPSTIVATNLNPTTRSFLSPLCPVHANPMTRPPENLENDYLLDSGKTMTW